MLDQRRSLSNRVLANRSAPLQERAPLDTLTSWVFVAMFACMPVSFLIPSRVVHLLPATALATVLIVLNLKSGKRGAARAGFLPVLAGMFLIATASCIVNAQEEPTIESYLGGYFSVLIVYLAVRFHRPNGNEFDRALLAYSAVAMVSLLAGVNAFYAVFGIPDLASLMTSRFMPEQIIPYQAATWGNVNNTATFLVQITPLFLVAMMDPTRRSRERLWFFACVTVCMLNLLIVGSRAAFFVFPVFLVLALFYCRLMGNKTVFMVMVSLVIAITTYLNGNDGRFWEYLGRATSIQRGDDSVGERVNSIIEGWEVMWEHAIFGVGPGCGRLHISYDAAHQMSVHHGAEYGIFGMLANLTLVLLVGFRIAQLLRARSGTHDGRLEFACLLSAFSFLLIGSLANAIVSIGTTNPWGTTLAATLGFADSYRSSVRRKLSASRPQLATSGRRIASPC